MKTRSGLVITVVLLSVGALVSAMQWTQDMVRGPAVLPQENLMLPPPGVLSVDGELILDRLDAEERLTNPLPSTPEVLEQGRWLYETYCDVCHGPAGLGDGPVAKHFRSRLPELTAAYIQGYADGYLYSILREGGFAMPGYAEVLSPAERWMLVHYIRSLPRR